MAKAKRMSAEFQKILNQRPSMCAAKPIWQRIRAAKPQGDTAKARTAYQDFLAQWKDADPRRPHP